MKVRTRIAPSPTGFVHIGTIHNALFAHALARKYNGEFILRIEDTDQKRYVPGSVEQLLEILDEFGLTPDEGPLQGGPHAPYIQSERQKIGIYKKAALKLVEKGFAYYCFLTEEELKGVKEVESGQRKAFRSPYRDQPIEKAKERIAKGDSYVVRLKVPENEVIEVEDAILGKVSWDSNEVDDQVLLKSDGFPTYHLAVVVDDSAMGITHVTRAYEWLPSTPKQVLLYKYLGYQLPIFAHSSLILDPDGGKLSKRKGTVSAKQFLVDGYLVDAILNFLMLLGWSAPIKREHGEKEREIFSHEEFIGLYELKDRHKSNAIFNREKLLWFNQQYIKVKTSEELAEIFKDWLKRHYEENVKDKAQKSKVENEDYELLKKIVEDRNISEKIKLVQERAKTLVEMLDSIKFFYLSAGNIDWEIEQIKGIKGKVEDIKKDIVSYHKSLDENSKMWANEDWVNEMKKISTKYGLKPGDSFMVLRLAIAGSPYSPPLFECLQILGKEEVLKRLKIKN